MRPFGPSARRLDGLWLSLSSLHVFGMDTASGGGAEELEEGQVSPVRRASGPFRGAKGLVLRLGYVKGCPAAYLSSAVGGPERPGAAKEEKTYRYFL